MGVIAVDECQIIDGYVTLPADQPGIGMELKSKLMDEMQNLLELI